MYSCHTLFSLVQKLLQLAKYYDVSIFFDVTKISRWADYLQQVGVTKNKKVLSAIHREVTVTPGIVVVIVLFCGTVHVLVRRLCTCNSLTQGISKYPQQVLNGV